MVGTMRTDGGRLCNRQWLLASQSREAGKACQLRLAETPIPQPTEGQVLVRHHYLSFDPCLRGHGDGRRGGVAQHTPGSVMAGHTVGEVIASCHRGFEVGDRVFGHGGWQEYSVVDLDAPHALRKVDTARNPSSAYLGVLGMPGVTAWYGLTHICAPESGETIVVSAAGGAVGSVVGQLAKLRGCRVVGFAAGPDECRYVVEDLGLDACVDTTAHPDPRALREALEQLAPDGVDACFENVAGAVLDATLACMNAHGRIALCGAGDGCDGGPAPISHPELLLRSRLRLEGFVASERLLPSALGELSDLVASGLLKYRESVSQGIVSAPEAFVGLFQGGHFGRQLVRLV